MNFDVSKLHVEEYAINFGAAFAILVIGWMLAGWLGGVVRQATTRSGRISPTLIPLFAKLTRLAILAVVILAALNKVGVETSGVFAMLGAAGLAVGLALKDTVSDVAAGIVLLVLRPFDVGDAVNIGATGGTVMAVDIFQTRLTSFDGVPIVVNNSAVRTAVIQNFSRAQQRRVELEVGIGYADDIAKAIAAIRETLAVDARVIKEAGTIVATKNLADGAVMIVARWTTRAADFEPSKFDAMRAIKERFDREGITLPAANRLLAQR